MKTHGMSKSPEYSSWVAMKKRCYYHKTNDYDRYGGAGITVCSEWRDSFETFYKDLGPRPKGDSLDRIDGTKGYFPGNVRWATASEQAKNRIISSYHAKQTVSCLYCKHEFQCGAYQIRRGEGKYCSQRCAWLADRKRIIVQCAYCSKSIERLRGCIKSTGNYCCISHARKGTSLKKLTTSCNPSI